MLVDAVIIFALVSGAAFVLGATQGHRDFTILMLIYGLVLSTASVISVADSKTFADWSVPYLADSDGTRYFEEARLLAQGGLSGFQTIVQANYAGYQLLLGALFGMFGPSLVVAVIANDLLLLLSILCLYRATFLLTDSARAALLACAAFMMTTSSIFYALMLLKEPAIGLAFALVLLAIAKAVHERSLGVLPAVYALIALLIIISMRASVLLFLVILLLFVSDLLIKRRLHMLAAFVGVVVVVAPFAQNFTPYELNAAFFSETIVSNQTLAGRFAERDLDLSGFTGRVIASYMELPFPVRVVLFPLPMATQILLPFDFWSSRFLDEHFANFFARNLNPLWYLYIVVWVGFAVFSVRRKQNPLIRRLLLAGLFYYATVAVIYSGLIPRYGMPALFFIFPAVGYWWAKAREDTAVQARARIFFGHYYGAAFIAGLGFTAFQLSRFV